MGMVAILVMWPGPFEQTFIPSSQGDSIWLQLASRLLRKRRMKILNLSDLDQGQWMTLAIGTHKASYTHLVDFIYQLYNTTIRSPGL